MNSCPQRAIETSHGYIAAIMVLFNMGIAVWFWQGVARFITIPAENGWAQVAVTLTGWVLCFAVMVLSYRVFHYLLRIPGIRQLIYYSSLTRFQFWRRYKPFRKLRNARNADNAGMQECRN
jgi:hypothetical protein